ncbi:type I-C CRISPR-associated protein Cas5c [Bifidobacterium sp. ESL0704]|uniref:type I-C CRISPR-associated protein Cas5c n=1 Tax=Bifidobacterium sp. ESL0704 TaxID=2983219 RepID=UPI0023F86532|nr:type I-C CRISPR-associated protein Cas5c [Bifidobacterium sp. ESL0704]WEV53572.1 type I-C CRISPR-associated protein Cas5c [Bifidobacterium sp. ESL0704]
MAIQLEVWGSGALFTRPEMSVERVSYDVMTPSAARGILEAIYWHPGMRWVVDKITVMNPIKFDNIRRNEVSSVLSARTAHSMMEGKGGEVIYTSDTIQQRASTFLRDVHYVIEAHFDMTDRASKEDSPAKFISIFNRRVAKGQCFHHPYFGCREFPVDFKSWEDKQSPKGFEQGKRDLGYMLYDMDYRDPENIKPLFFRAELNDGVMNLENARVVS